MKGTKIKYLAYLIIILFLLTWTGCLLPNVEIAPSPSPPPVPTTTPVNPDWTLPPVESLAPPLPDIASVVALVKPSVVAINTEVVTYDIFNRPSTQRGAGSGWIMDKDGLIVTNNHVVEGAESVTVTMVNGRTLPAETIRTDRLTDLAVVRIDASNLPAVNIGDSYKLRVGDWVVAIGNPLGLGISAKEGIISRIGVSIDVSSGQTLYDLVETSAAINPGNSGGPLVNMAGEVIGITSAKLSAVGVEGLGYAISSNTASPIIEELVQNGYIVRPWLGVVLRSVDQYVVFQNKLTVNEGAFITEVASGSPAEKAGVKPGDVIVSFGGKKITSADDLIQAIHSSQIGQEVEMILWRDNANKTTYIRLMESPSP
jgi:serine protease Do